MDHIRENPLQQVKMKKNHKPHTLSLRRFRKDRSGATAVEFAMVGGPFLALFLATFEAALVLFVNEGVESAVEAAGRMVMTGQVQATSADQFRDKYICNPAAPRKRLLPSFIACDKLLVDVRSVAAFGSADTARTFYRSVTKFCTGSPGAVVVIRAAYPMPVYLPILNLVGFAVKGENTTGQVEWGGGMKHMIIGTATFRNEAYPNSAAGTSC
jgi:Flp pilus assembly protein TadG